MLFGVHILRTAGSNERLSCSRRSEYTQLLSHQCNDGYDCLSISSHIHPEKANGEIVKIYDDGIGISTEDSELIITDIKVEGKNRVSVKQFLNGKKEEDLLGKVFE